MIRQCKNCYAWRKAGERGVEEKSTAPRCPKCGDVMVLLSESVNSMRVLFKKDELKKD